MSRLPPLLILISLFSTTALALEPQQGWVYNIFVLDGSLDLEPAYAFDQVDVGNQDLLQYGVGVGYAIGNGFITELRVGGGTSDVLDFPGIDSYDFAEIQLAAAYDWYFSPRFSVGPELRLSKIILESDESSWYPSEPDEEYEVKDSALSWALRGKWRATQRFTLALEYGQTHYKFGDVRTAGLGFQWHF